MASAADRDPRHHTRKMQKVLQEIRSHLRENIQEVDEPQLKAMCETSAEVLGGLKKAVRNYEGILEHPHNFPTGARGDGLQLAALIVGVLSSESPAVKNMVVIMAA